MKCVQSEVDEKRGETTFLMVKAVKTAGTVQMMPMSRGHL